MNRHSSIAFTVAKLFIHTEMYRYHDIDVYIHGQSILGVMNQKCHR
jgi:hypothetical protein